MPTLAELRTERNLSQIDLAGLTGLSTSAISRLENGHPIQKTTLTLVCQALGVSPSDVTGVNLYSAVQAAAKRKKRIA
jgi:transcriptional regulator with XRE-family HTH domain